MAICLVSSSNGHIPDSKCLNFLLNPNIMSFFYDSTVCYKEKLFVFGCCLKEYKLHRPIFYNTLYNLLQYDPSMYCITEKVLFSK